MKVVILLLIYLLAPIVVILLFRNVKAIRQIGTVMMAYAIGIILALIGFMPVSGEVDYEAVSSLQKWIQNLTIPIAIPLMLFSCDFKLWTKSLPKTFAALLGGIASIVIAVVIAFFIFKDSGIDDINNVAAMMVGIYTGGTMNFYALGSALHVNPDTIVIAYTFEVLVTFPFIIFIVAGGYKLLRKFLPYKDVSATVNTTEYKDIEDGGIENYGGMFKRETFPKMLLALLTSVIFLAVGAGLSLLLTGKLNEMIIILTITTLSIAASFNKNIRKLPKTFELGMFFILIFSVVVASQFDIYSIDTNAMMICLFILTILVISIVLHLIFSRISKVPGDLFTVSHIGLLCSPPFIPPIVGAMKNKKVLISGIVIGLVGYAIGTYLGVFLAQVFRWIN